MKEASKISIVTPSFNQANFIEEAIFSVLDQGYLNFEHIIIDGGSTDGTLEILKKYSHLKWISEKDDGQSDALNKGFRLATGDIIGWLNSDDRYLPDAFFRIEDYFASNPNIDIVYGDYRWIDKEGNVFQLRREIGFDPFILKYLHTLYIPTTSTFFRKHIFSGKNFLDTKYDYSMDYEFFLRLYKRGYKFGHVRAFIADFRWHSTSKSQSCAIKQRDDFERILIYYSKPMQRIKYQIPRRLLRWILMILARAKRTCAKALIGGYSRQFIKKQSDTCWRR